MEEIVRTFVREELEYLHHIEDTCTKFKTFDGRVRDINNYVDRMMLHTKVVNRLANFMRDHRNDLNPEEIKAISNFIDDICSGILITDPEYIDGKLYVNTLG